MTEGGTPGLLPPDWRAALGSVLDHPDLRTLTAALAAEEAAGARIFPPAGERLRALELTPLAAVRVVILGQDPYHRAGQAHGLAFSVRPGVRSPPSLANIFRELESDLGLARPGHGFLEHWARQGVLLLNAVLSVAEGQAGSHHGRGWERFTDAVIAAVAAAPAPSVFLLWGAYAQKKAAIVETAASDGRHLVLRAAHPSPLARGAFFGSRPFSQANAFLRVHGRGEIDWALPAAT